MELQQGERVRLVFVGFAGCEVWQERKRCTMTYHWLSPNWVMRVLVYRFSRSGVGFAREVRPQRAMTTSGVVYISSGIWMLMVGSNLMSEGGL